MNTCGLLHQEISVTPFTLGIMHRGFHQFLHDTYLGLHFENSFIVYKNYKVDWYGDLVNFSDLGERVIALSQEGDFSKKLLDDTIELGKKITTECKRIDASDLSSLSDKQLTKELTDLYLLSNKICDVGQMAVFPDLRFYKLSTLLKNIIKEKRIAYGCSLPTNEYYSTLVASARTYIGQQEKKDILLLADRLSHGTLSSLFKKMPVIELIELMKKEYTKEYADIVKINDAYKWLVFGQLGPAKTIEQTVEDFRDIIMRGNIKKELSKIESETHELKEKQKEYEKELCLKKEERMLFSAARDFGYNKLYRYEVLLYVFYNLDNMLQEISHRIDYTVKQLQFMTHEEIVSVLLGSKTISKDEIKKRQHLCLAYITPQGSMQFLTGDKAKLYIKQHVQTETVKEDIMVVHGSVAFMGRVFGKVRIVNSKEDIEKVEEGDVLISIQTNPDLLPAMKRAAALVTDIGGITSHAAIVARELKKPCIIGTKIATKIFKDGDMVDVDATKGDVKKITQ